MDRPLLEKILLCDWMLGRLHDKNGKSEILGGPLLNFRTLFGKSQAIYGLFETVMSERSNHVSSSTSRKAMEWLICFCIINLML